MSKIFSLDSSAPKVYFRYLRFERLCGAYAYILHIRACMVQFTLSVNFKGVT